MNRLANMEGGKFHRVQDLDKKLQAAKDSYEQEKFSVPGMNSLIGYPNPMIASILLNGKKTQSNLINHKAT